MSRIINKSLLLNPHIRVVQGKDETKILGFYCPVKGKGRFFAKFNHRPDLLRKTKAVIQSKGRTISRLSLKDRERLHDSGVLIERKERSRIVHYCCDLSDFTKTETNCRYVSFNDFILNPSLIYQKNGGVPPFFSDRISVPPELDCSGPTAWVEDPFTKIVYPFAISNGVKKTFENLCVKSRSGFYETSHIEVLRQSRILLTEEDFRLTGKTLRGVATRLGAAMQKEKHACLSFLLNPIHLKTFQKYSQRLLEEGWLDPPRDDIRLRMTRHNDPIATFFHRQMGAYISNFMGTRYHPSFSFLAIHREGSRFKKHRDRSQCDLVCSLLVDYSPETKIQDAWPLFLRVRNHTGRYQEKAVRLRIGEALAFRGHTVTHYRPPLPPNHASSHVLFCFVPAEFAGSLD